MIINIIIAIILIIIIYALLILLFSISFNVNNADYLIILGHKLENDKMDNVLRYRLRKAVRYIDKNPKCKIVLSGGVTVDNSISEASVMQNYLIKNGIDENRIILEDKSVDTVENINNCLNYIDVNSSIVIISSNYHILRSKMICKMLGFKKVKGIGSYTPIKDLIKHLAIEEVYMFIHYFRIKNRDL